MTEALEIEVRCFCRGEVVSHALAPLLVAICECIFTNHTDALTMPKGRDKVHPLLMTVCSLRAFEQLVDSREHLVGQ